MTKTTALKVGSKLEWYYNGYGVSSVTMTVTDITRGRIYVEYVDAHGNHIKGDWSRRKLNSAYNIVVLSV